MSERQQFVVERESWLRGEGSGASALLRPSDNKQCCVGFYLEQRGAMRELLKGTPSACDIGAPISAAARWLLAADINDGNSPQAGKIYEVNDLTSIDDSERERRLTELFAAQGIDVRFE